MGSKGRNRSDNSNIPWIGHQPGLLKQQSRAEDLWGEGARPFFPGQTFAGADPLTRGALGATGRLGLRGSASLQGATDLNRRTVRGDFLSPESNQHLRGAYEAGSEQMGRRYADIVGGGIGGRFGGQGGTGSPQELRAMEGAQGQLGSQLRGLASDIYGGNYQQERSRQQAAGQFAPALGEARFGELAAAGQAGQGLESYEQMNIDDLMARFDWQTGGAEQARFDAFRQNIGGASAPIMTSFGKSRGRTGSGIMGLFS